MKQQLLSARRLLEKCGWVGPKLEPWCRDSRGRAVHHTDEGVQTFSCGGALQLYGEFEPAWAYLGRVTSPELARLEDFVAQYSHEDISALEPGEFLVADWKWRQLAYAAGGSYLNFGGWLCQLDRTREELLRVFTTAVLRSTREKCT